MIQLIEIKKEFGERVVSNGVNLTIPEGKMTAIIGRSGEGKSVLLKQIVGLIQPTSGQIIIDGIEITNLPQQKKEGLLEKFGYVFQFAALLDSLTVFQNIGITLLERGDASQRVLEIVKEQLRMVNLPEDVLYRYPSDLSGGMRKRVGLARTLVAHPKVILYDEPTTGLDPITTRIIHELMFDMQKKFNLTSVVVSHDVEIFKYADQVALLHEGKIRYTGEAKDIWDCQNPYVFQFIRGLSEGPMQSDKVKNS